MIKDSVYGLKQRGIYPANSPYVTGAWVTGKRSRKLPSLSKFNPEPVPSRTLLIQPPNRLGPDSVQIRKPSHVIEDEIDEMDKMKRQSPRLDPGQYIDPWRVV